MVDGGEGKTQDRVMMMAMTYVEAVDLRGSWFELGGTSLDGARLVSRAERELGVRIALRALLDAPSIHDFLARLPGGERTRPSDARPAPAGPDPVDLLWPSLIRLSARDRLVLAHRLLTDVLGQSAPPPAVERR